MWVVCFTSSFGFPKSPSESEPLFCSLISYSKTPQCRREWSPCSLTGCIGIQTVVFPSALGQRVSWLSMSVFSQCLLFVFLGFLCFSLIAVPYCSRFCLTICFPRAYGHSFLHLDVGLNWTYREPNFRKKNNRNYENKNNRIWNKNTKRQTLGESESAKL